MAATKPANHIAYMGIGDAILRLIRVEMKRANGTRVSVEALKEADMLVTALNAYDLQVAFDCDADGNPDTVAVFEAAASTSCCRLVPTGKPGPEGAALAKKMKKRRDTSRRGK